MLTAAIFIALNNSLISKTYFPQCLFFKKKNTHLQTLYLCSLDAIRLSSSRETQQILIENPHQIFREGQYWKGGGSNYEPGCFWIFIFDSAREASNNVNTFLNLRFIKKQKPAVFYEKIYANKLKVKMVSLNVLELL